MTCKTIKGTEMLEEVLPLKKAPRVRSVPKALTLLSPLWPTTEKPTRPQPGLQLCLPLLIGRRFTRTSLWYLTLNCDGLSHHPLSRGLLPPPASHQGCHEGPGGMLITQRASGAGTQAAVP